MTSPVKKVAALHDISGFGRSSLTVVIPVLSAMGVYVCPVPTALLSTNTSYPDPYIVDLTEHIEPIVSHWKKLGLKFDGIYSGFLGSPKQCEIVAQIISDFGRKNQLVLVDPVLGDEGKLYESMDSSMVVSMRRLIRHADLITPNITEAQLLVGKKCNSDVTIDEIKEDILCLKEEGPKLVVVTGILDKKTSTSFVIAYNSEDDKFWKVSCNYVPAEYPGAGDTFSSVMCGALLQGDSLPIALDRAMNFVYYGIRSTYGYMVDPREGILQERILNTLNMPSPITAEMI